MPIPVCHIATLGSPILTMTSVCATAAVLEMRVKFPHTLPNYRFFENYLKARARLEVRL